MLYLANDLHRKQITVSVRDDAGQVLEKRQVSTRPEKIRAFLESVRERAGGEGFMAILEVCGFHQWYVELLREYGCREIVLIHPDTPSKKKTDRRDADKLGQLLWVNRDRLQDGQKPHGLRRVVIPSADDEADRQLTTLRERAGKLRTQTINKVQGILRKHNLMWEQPTKGINTQTARRWLQRVELPAIDRLEMDQLLAQWELWEQQIEELQETIAQRAARSPAAGVVARAIGLGGYGSLAISSRIGDVKRFARPRSLPNYFGITPGCRNSGEQTDRLGSITKQGSRMVRFILGQAVVHVLRRDPVMREWYRRIKRRRGSKIARVAVMRRLCTIIWHMLTYDEPYTPGGPPRLRQQKQRQAAREAS